MVQPLQKPQQVIDVLNDFYKNKNANIHRGVHLLVRKLQVLMKSQEAPFKNI